MKTLLLICAVVICNTALGCSGLLRSFCYTHASRLNDPVVKGTIIAVGTQSIQVKVLEVIHGSETRSVVTIWDGQDFNCTGNISMKASGIGASGDTILAILPLIVNVVNVWDVVGDYTRPYYLFFQPVLKVINDSLIGIINNNFPNTNYYVSVDKMKYSDFKSYWIQHSNDCVELVGLSTLLTNASIIIVVQENFIQIQALESDKYQAQILSLQGQILAEFRNAGNFTVSTDNLASGIYIVTLKNQLGEIYRRKIIK